jgi:hypothetical protein
MNQTQGGMALDGNYRSPPGIDPIPKKQSLQMKSPGSLGFFDLARLDQRPLMMTTPAVIWLWTSIGLS